MILLALQRQDARSKLPIKTIKFSSCIWNSTISPEIQSTIPSTWLRFKDRTPSLASADLLQLCVQTSSVQKRVGTVSMILVQLARANAGDPSLPETAPKSTSHPWTQIKSLNLLPRIKKRSNPLVWLSSSHLLSSTTKVKYNWRVASSNPTNSIQ